MSREMLLRAAVRLMPLACAGWAPVNQEVVPATESADIPAVVQTIEGAIKGAYALGGRPAMRDAHAKGHGCVRAEFRVEPDVPARLKAGVFAEPRAYKAWIRFSNGSGAPHDDHAGDGRGMAIKLTGVSGKKLLADSNAGHWWTDDAGRPGRIGPKLTDPQKYAIIEYLKAATYDDYPAEPRAQPDKVACADEPDWARGTKTANR